MFSFYFLTFNITEADEILVDSSMPGTEIRNHEVHIGNSGAIATSSMRKSMILSNGASNTTHELNSGTGKIFDHFMVVVLFLFCFQAYTLNSIIII